MTSVPVQVELLTTLECNKAEGVGGNGYRLAACIYDKKGTYAVAINTTKTHPLMLKFNQYPHLHAEVHACIKMGLQNCRGKSIFVMRLKKNGDKANAKPCPSCQQFLKYVGITSINYTNELGYNDWLELS